MDILRELKELKETISNEIAQANKEIKKSGGDLNTGDIEMIDKLTHTMKSLETTCAMLEAEEGDGYSERYIPRYGGRYSGRYDGYIQENRNGSGSYGGYSRNDRRYSRGMDWNEHLRRMMDEAPDEATRMDIKKLMDRMGN